MQTINVCEPDVLGFQLMDRQFPSISLAEFKDRTVSPSQKLPVSFPM